MFSWLVNHYDRIWSADLWDRYPDAEAAAVGVFSLLERRDLSPAISQRGAALAAGALWLLAADRYPSGFGRAIGALCGARGSKYTDPDAVKTVILVRARAGLFVVPMRSRTGGKVGAGSKDLRSSTIVAHAVDVAKARDLADSAGFRKAGGRAWCGVYNAFGTPAYIPAWHKRSSAVAAAPRYVGASVVVDALKLPAADRLLLGWGRSSALPLGGANAVFYRS